MKTKKMIVSLIVIVLVVALIPTFAYAKGRKIGKTTSRIYKDVTSRTVDAESCAGIQFVKEHGGWNGLIRRGRFFPNLYMTRKEFLIALHNLYGGRVYANIEDIILSDQIVTSDFCCQRMVAMSEGLGYKIAWNGKNVRLRRKDVARYIKIFATYNPKLMPRK